jgi:hypothetical protein
MQHIDITLMQFLNKHENTPVDMIPPLISLVDLLIQLQADFEFEHFDMHAMNIMIRPNQRQVFLLDFDSSRIKLDDVDVGSDRFTRRTNVPPFNPSYDLMYLLFSTAFYFLPLLKLPPCQPILQDVVNAIHANSDVQKHMRQVLLNDLHEQKRKQPRFFPYEAQRDIREIATDPLMLTPAKLLTILKYPLHYKKIFTFSGGYGIELSSLIPSNFKLILQQCLGHLTFNNSDKPPPRKPPPPPPRKPPPPPPRKDKPLPPPRKDKPLPPPRQGKSKDKAPEQQAVKNIEFYSSSSDRSLCSTSNSDKANLGTILEYVINYNTAKQEKTELPPLPALIKTVSEESRQNSDSQFFKLSDRFYFWKKQKSVKSGSFGDTFIVEISPRRSVNEGADRRLKRQKFSAKDYAEQIEQAMQQSSDPNRTWTIFWNDFNTQFLIEITIQLFLQCNLRLSRRDGLPIAITAAEVTEILKLKPLEPENYEFAGETFQNPYDLVLLMYNENMDVSTWFKDTPHNVRQAQDLLVSIAMFLQRAQERFKFIHKDFKANNVVLSGKKGKDGGFDVTRLHVIDFGFSQISIPVKINGKPTNYTFCASPNSRGCINFAENRGRDLMNFILTPRMITHNISMFLEPCYKEFVLVVQNNIRFQAIYNKFADRVPTDLKDFTQVLRRNPLIFHALYSSKYVVDWKTTRPDNFLRIIRGERAQVTWLDRQINISFPSDNA